MAPTTALIRWDMTRTATPTPTRVGHDAGVVLVGHTPTCQRCHATSSFDSWYVSTETMMPATSTASETETRHILGIRI